ncbi:hypothetical protein B0H11DRAFT_721465 [Mycena galericulata]|nr:hypothetical protein B0H11DRAFT_721465 [Mycena galericulata]
MSSTSIYHLVSFLTRPLMRSHVPATILSLQLYLQTAFSSQSTTDTNFLLSARCPPPPQMQQACLAFGVRWAEWIHLISCGLDLQLFVTEIAVSVQLGTRPRRVIWAAADNADKSAPAKVRSAGLPFSTHLRATLAAARTRRGAALNPTRIPTLLSSSSFVASSDADSDSESDSDGDSDSGYSFTSASSATSVSSGSCFESESSKPVVNPTADVTRYLYQGGVTQVMSGGVMLGAAAPKPNSFAFAAPPYPKRAAVVSNGRPVGISRNAVRKTGVSTADSWRRSA